MRSVVLALLLAAGLALASGRGGYRVEVGERFTIRLWAEEVLMTIGPFEQVAGLELEYGPNGLWYWAPYTGIGFNGDGWWAMAQFRYAPGDAVGLAIVGGVTW